MEFKDRPGPSSTSGDSVRGTSAATEQEKLEEKKKGKKCHILHNLTEEDLTRVQNLRVQRIASDRARIQRLSLNESHLLLERCLNREPSLLFDLLDTDPNPEDPPPLQTLSRCVCGKCRDMPTLIERKCCGKPPQHCISLMPHMDLFILEDGVLRLARRIWNDLRAEEDSQELGESNREFRFAAYRQFVVWRYGILGRGNRIVIPSCCVWKT
ncbi:P2X purinoceptor 7 [Boleophthalmus pectinirostris]|uniref:P2X purinoceptor 7 n=1 Tax=Boleophthalmus pectinirostris TaxID=150288 RepID=UPI002430333B|nr:P2X purinoceptor 7 [Boleophthalmus pectinirostris]